MVLDGVGVEVGEQTKAPLRTPFVDERVHLISVFDFHWSRSSK